MKPKMTPEQKRLLATAHNKALGPTVRAQALAALKRSLTGTPVPQARSPIVTPQRPSQPLTAFEQAHAKAQAERELEVWTRDAESRLRQALTLGRSEEAEQIKRQMRARGLRPIGDPDPPKPDRPPAPMPELRERVIGRPRPTGEIVEFRNGSWKEWLGD
jgi:hypothetical protein